MTQRTNRNRRAAETLVGFSGGGVRQMRDRPAYWFGFLALTAIAAAAVRFSTPSFE